MNRTRLVATVLVAGALVAANTGCRNANPFCSLDGNRDGEVSNDELSRIDTANVEAGLLQIGGCAREIAKGFSSGAFTGL